MGINLFKTSALLSFALLLGRISGLGRELLLSYKLGLSQQADCAVLLLTFPDLIANLLLAGGFNAAFIPLIKRVSKKMAQKIFFKILLWVCFISLCICGFFILFPKVWFYLFAPGYLAIKNQIHIPWIIVIVSVPIAMMSCVLNAHLNANEKFFITGLGTLILNLFIILSLLICRDFQNILMFLSLGILSGTLFRLFTQWIVKPSVSIEARESDTNLSLIDNNFLKNFILASFCSFIIISLPFFMRTACSCFENGQIAAFNYANKIIEIPLNLFITNVGVILYPLLCAPSIINKMYLQTLALQKTVLLSIFFVLFGVILGNSVLQLIYQHGRFWGSDVKSIYIPFCWLLLSLPLYAVNTIFTAQLNANNGIKKVWYSNAIGFLFFLILVLISIKIESVNLLYLAFILFHIICNICLIKFGKPIIVFTRTFVAKLFSIIFLAILCFLCYISNFGTIAKYIICYGISIFTLFITYKFDYEKNL